MPIYKVLVVVTILVRPGVSTSCFLGELDLTYTGAGVTPAVTRVVVGPRG